MTLHISPSLVNTLTTYTDADWGGCPDTRSRGVRGSVWIGFEVKKSTDPK